MKKIVTQLSIGLVALNFAFAAYAADNNAKSTYKAAKESAEETYKASRAKCDSLSGNPKDVCVAEAKAEEKRSKAHAEAQYENTPKARMKAHIAEADADYDVAKEKCDAHTGNDKHVCVKEAKAAHTKAKVDAKAHKEIAEIKSDAAQEKHDADYKVMLEKCDALAGSAKDSCVTSAKSKFGK